MTDTPNPFQSLAACLSEGERLCLELHRQGEALAVLVQPVLNAAPPGLDAEQQRLRAALAENARPESETPLFHAPLMNVDANGQVCLSTADVPPDGTLAYRAD